MSKLKPGTVGKNSIPPHLSKCLELCNDESHGISNLKNEMDSTGWDRWSWPGASGSHSLSPDDVI